jgi:2'-5' RNA ligase
MYAIELYLAEPEAGLIRRMWDNLAQIGLSAMRDNGSRPHVTLGVFGEIDRAVIEEQLDRFFETQKLHPITFEVLGFFPASRVLHATPTVTAWLLDLHRAFHQAVADISAGPSLYYLPGRWVPHCTLAFDIPPEQVAEAFGRVASGWFPLTGHFDEAGLVRPSKTATNYLYVRPVRSN